jgi:hypothetical protein
MSAPTNAPLLDRVREAADSRNLSAEEFKQIVVEPRAGRRGRIRSLRQGDGLSGDLCLSRTWIGDRAAVTAGTLFEEMGFCYVADRLRVHS